MRSISIEIDTASGAIRLNPGYAEGSPEFASETSLFAEYEPAIVEILVNEVPSDDPAYKAFLEAANEDRDARHELLARVRTSVVDARDARGLDRKRTRLNSRTQCARRMPILA